MATRQHKNTSQYSPLPLPLEGTEQVEVWRNGAQYQTTLDVLGGNPGPHGESHESGSDRIGTQTPTADAIVRGDDDGLIDGWVSDATTTKKGKAQFAAHNEKAANKMVQADDPRNENPRPPTAHAASHIGGTDDLGLGTAALLDVGVADGVCGLDSSGKVSSSNLPSYVDDVIEVANYSALPVTGETGKIYVTLDDNLTYRWTGSAYVEISKSLALGETSSTAYRGDHGKTAYDHSQAAHAPSNADNTQGAINGAAAKATPVDADVFGFLDSAASFIMKKMTAANVKAWLKAYFDTLYTGAGGGGSVDNTFRVAEYTGDGIPLIPDNAAGVAYESNFSTTDGWDPVVSGNSLTVSNGSLITTVGAGNVEAYLLRDVSPVTNPMLAFRLKLSYAREFAVFATVNGVESTLISYFIADSVYKMFTAYIPGTITRVYIVVYGYTVNASIMLEKLYIGTGAYDTPALDRSGNGNNLTLNAVTPVNGKYGKEMSFNGSTSYAQASSPVIGATGTIAIRLKPASLLTSMIPFGNRNASMVGGVVVVINSTDGVVSFVIGKADGSVQQILAGTVSTSVYTAFTFTWDGTTVKTYRNGVLIVSTAQAEPYTSPQANLTIGRTAASAQEYFNGIISHFRYDSRVWTADEALAWSLNPISVDSRA